MDLNGLLLVMVGVGVLIASTDDDVDNDCVSSNFGCIKSGVDSDMDDVDDECSVALTSP